MIFLTVETQFAFARLVKAVDEAVYNRFNEADSVISHAQ
jgi:hypothetical protein